MEIFHSPNNISPFKGVNTWKQAQHHLGREWEEDVEEERNLKRSGGNQMNEVKEDIANS